MKPELPTDINKQLDSVLTILNHDKVNEWDSIEEIYKNFPYTTGIRQVILIVEKLILDGNVREDKTGIPSGYFITLNGRLLIDNGGYEKAAAVSDSNRLSEELGVRRTFRITRSLNRATWFAGVSAALLLLWNVFEFFYERCVL